MSKKWHSHFFDSPLLSCFLSDRSVLIGQAGEIPPGQIEGVMGGLGTQPGPDRAAAQLQGTHMGAPSAMASATSGDTAPNWSNRCWGTWSIPAFTWLV